MTTPTWLTFLRLDDLLPTAAHAIIETSREAAHHHNAAELPTGVHHVTLSLGDGFRHTILTAVLTPADGLYGDLLVALPDYHRAALMSAHGFHTPDYVNEKLTGLPGQGPRIVAAYLTAISDQLITRE